jgi:hypothetical protein
MLSHTHKGNSYVPTYLLYRTECVSIGCPGIDRSVGTPSAFGDDPPGDIVPGDIVQAA